MIVPLSPQASIVSRVISKRRRRNQPAVGLESQRHPLGPHLSRPQEINLNTVSAGQAVGIKEVQDDIWLVSFIDCDLG